MHERPSLGPPSDLTLPVAGSRTARAIFHLAMRHLLADLRELESPPGLSEAERQGYRRLREVLAEIGPIHPEAIPNLLRCPVVAAPLRVLCGGSEVETKRGLAEFVCQSFFRLAEQRVLPERVDLRLTVPTLISLSSGLALPVGPSVGSLAFASGVVYLGDEEVRFGQSDAFGRLPSVGAHAYLGVVDDDPALIFGMISEKERDRVDLGDRPTDEWVASLEEAFGLIEDTLPDLAAEMKLFAQVVIPNGCDPERHSPVRGPESIGSLDLSLHSDRVAMAEAVVRELSRGKLHALLAVDEVLKSPSRSGDASRDAPGERSSLDVLLSVHARLAVEQLYAELARPGHPDAGASRFGERRREIRALNRADVDTLRRRAKPTSVGSGVINEICGLDERFELEALAEEAL